MNVPTDQESASLSSRVATSFAPPQSNSSDHWQVVRHLGSGSTAHVWLMHHAGSKQYVACKTPKSPDDVAILSQEAELARTLSHENIVQYLDSDTTEVLPRLDPVGTFWEYLPAGSLGNLIAATGRLSLAQTVTILLPMMQVAEYLHSQQIAHGDISPRNIVFDLSGRPVLIDLGSTRATAHAFTITGTPGFIAPELESHDPELDGLGSTADVFSLAAVGWFCLTGTIPGPTHSRVPLVMLDNTLGKDVTDVLEACLTEEPVLRPSMEQLLTAVSHWAEPEPVDLFGAVGEDYELLLPTRKPTKIDSRPSRKFWQQRKPKNPVKKGNAAKTEGVEKPHRRRIFLGLGALAITGGVVATTVFAADDPPDTVAAQSPEIGPSPQATDFQSVLDSLAKSRSAAWTQTDSSLVREYAAEGSAVYEDDTVTLESLGAADSTLDGIRMRGVVDNADPTPNGAVVTVEWRIDGYVQRDAAGEILAEFDSRVDQLELTLVETADGWRIGDVAAGG